MTNITRFIKVIFQIRYSFLILITYCLLHTDSIGSSESSKSSFPVDQYNPFRNINESQLIDLVRRAYGEVRMFIYPIPPEVLPSYKTPVMLTHFKLEHKFTEYFKQLHNLSIQNSSSFKSILVSDPSEANVFLIDHWTLRMAFFGEKEAPKIWSHLKAIVENVIKNYPYYNRSQGYDHFFIATSDHGAICDSTWFGTKVEHITRIINASFIGNYGADLKTFTPDKIPCHRPGKDIVVPQIIDFEGILSFWNNINRPIYMRAYDSTFAGTIWEDRETAMKEMAEKMNLDYKSLSTEFYTFDYSAYNDHSLVLKGYFMYHACGNACWSKREFEALAHRTIPIIVGDGSIQAFEKFIDWTSISVKMSSDAWHNTSLRNSYRKKLRYASDDFRRAYQKDCKDSPTLPNQTDYQINNDYTSNNKFVSKCPNVSHIQDTLIYKKIATITNVVDWIDYNQADLSLAYGLSPPNESAYNMIVLEIWCRLLQLKKGEQSKVTGDSSGSNSKLILDIPEVCGNSADYTARKEYF